MQEKIMPDDSEMNEAELNEISGGISDLNKLGDQGSLEQMRMQQYMERRSKAFETLSNTMKKMSSTGNTITKNMK